MSYLEELKEEINKLNNESDTLSRKISDIKELYRKECMRETRLKKRYINDNWIDIVDRIRCSSYRVVEIAGINQDIVYITPVLRIADSDYYYFLYVNEENGNFEFSTKHHGCSINNDGGGKKLYRFLENFIENDLMQMYDGWVKQYKEDNIC